MHRTAMLLALAMSLAGFAVTGDASAEKICSSNEAGCSALVSGTNVSGTSTSFVFTWSLPITCTESSISGQTTAKEATPLPGEIESWTIGNCREGLFNTKCTATAFHLAYRFHIRATGGGDGELWIGPNPITGLAPGFKMVCGSLGTTCEFKAAEVQNANGSAVEEEAKWASLTFTGGNPATARASNDALVFAGGSGAGVCDSTALWNGVYTISAPNPLFVL